MGKGTWLLLGEGGSRECRRLEHWASQKPPPGHTGGMCHPDGARTRPPAAAPCPGPPFSGTGIQVIHPVYVNSDISRQLPDWQVV